MDKRLIFLGASALLAACGTDTTHERYGSIDVTASAPNIDKAFTTTDGWSVKYDRFLVSVAAITIAATETEVVAASASPQIFDAVAPPPVVLLSAAHRTAQTWDAFSFQIAPAAPLDEETPITLNAGVSDADSETMTKGGYSLYVEGKATKAGVTKTIKWGFATDITFSDCASQQEGALVKGVVIPPVFTQNVELAFRGDVLLADDLGQPAAPLRFAAFAAADADADGDITVDELTATTLESARRAGGTYGTAGEADVADLGSFAAALTRRVLASYRTNGTCTAAPTAPAAP
jgi:hypothetical protein